MTESQLTAGGGERIGPYLLVELLGEGGMGVVYRAEQLEPVKRWVALKVIRSEIASPEVIGRFENERQALAVMEHPAIAKVLDGGTTPAGNPYFVMEHVEGLPFTSYCDAQQLSPRERLELFVPVCEAIQHAHQKGVIHRDLKPSNVLVTEQAGRPQPIVIDFGIAKAVGHKLTERTLTTEFGAIMGTPAYMSPEQADGSGLDVDTRTDVYSLGVMLYETLVGKLPVDPNEVGFMPFLAQLLSRETSPPTPSARVSKMNGDRAELAARRGIEPRKFASELAGDLDWIVMKAIDPERDRRYETAQALRLDLERYLRDEPIEARPPSTVYRLKKFVRRNTVGVIAGAAAVLALMVGASAATVGFVRATRAEARALEEAATATQVVDFLTRAFAVSDPTEAKGNTITAREILDSGAVRIHRELSGQPLVQARLMLTMGTVYTGLALLRPAVPLLDSALAIRERQHGPSSPEVAEVLLAKTRVLSRQGDDAAARELGERALAIYEARLGPDALEVADALEVMPDYMWSEAMLSRQRRILEIRRRHLSADDPALADAYSAVGTRFSFDGEPDSAEAYLRTALAMYRAAGHIDQVRAIEGLASLATQTGQLDTALARYDEAIRLNARFHGPESPSTAGLLANKAVVLVRLERPAEAEALIRQASQMLITAYGPDALNLDWQMSALAHTLMLQEKWTEAAEASSALARIWERRGGGWTYNVPRTRLSQAQLLNAAGRRRDARALLEPLIQSFGDDPPAWAWSAYYTLAALDAAAGQRGQARERFGQAVQLMGRSRDPAAPSLRVGGFARPRPIVMGELLDDYAASERRAGRVSVGDSLAELAAAARTDVHGIAAGYRALGMNDSALVYLREAIRRGRSALPGDDQPLARALTQLATLLRAQGDRQGAADAYGELAALADTAQPATRDPLTRATLTLTRVTRYAAALRRAGRAAQAGAQRARSRRLLDSLIAADVLGAGAQAARLNAFCWWGSLAGHAERVLPVCDAAVEAADSGIRPAIMDSRGVARAMLNDVPGAIADFEAFVSSSDGGDQTELRRTWIAALRRGQNPMTQRQVDRLILP